MFRDSADEAQDKQMFESFKTDALDFETVQRYRNRFKLERPEHAWTYLADDDFLRSIGALSIDENDVLRPTSAGLLMFGYEYRITDEFPHYFLDYQTHALSTLRT